MLTEAERKLIRKAEQTAYEQHILVIESILEKYQNGLDERGFWTECSVTIEGMRFRYSLYGYYGPGGFSSQFHIAGPLVVGLINPKQDAVQAFYKNDLDQNAKLGSDFNADAFDAFVEENILSYLALENLIISKDQYESVRAIYPRQ